MAQRVDEPPRDDEHGDDDYHGSAVVFTAEREADVEVVLRGNFQPIDGRFHWYGRATAGSELDELVDGRKAEVVLRTPHGDAVATLSDPDPWNRYRITGLGRPPFPIDSELVELGETD
ncbi:hypothetical protein J2S53_002120 [Actinopolyspora lacussalsi]|uniref:DUF4873 domain-containing protein n=1 Tax=Actinopolyspora righensis TaxID=995060 RepID=A0A1I7AI48_9ACTN|nr:DUF4873 domain-containing protein [Actinopolyspora righensis]MDP9642175.1 hypothetical protein [Actinopolyspora lacussalsi]SFT74621.1 protein of unknown function [Actinopolyspora righensis]